jgi:predicted ribosomally synthesized peptide with SipW-like signal peptide
MSKKKVVGISVVVIALIVAAFVAYAYFTDRVTGNGSVKAGDVAVTITDMTVNEGDDAADVIAPGCSIPISYTITNTGSLAVDTREKIVLSVFDKDGQNGITLSDTPSEFEIYDKDDVELTSGKGWTAKSGATPIGTKVETTADNSIVYYLDQVTLDSSEDELEDISIQKIKKDYAIIFRGTASNEFMDCNVKVEVISEAKQHAFTSDYDNDWTELQSVDLDLTTNDITQKVVPSKNQFTSN